MSFFHYYFKGIWDKMISIWWFNVEIQQPPKRCRIPAFYRGCLSMFISYVHIFQASHCSISFQGLLFIVRQRFWFTSIIDFIVYKHIHIYDMHIYLLMFLYVFCLFNLYNCVTITLCPLKGAEKRQFHL